MNIGEVLSRAWNIIWKYKVLWIFGLFAGLAGGGGGNNFRYNFEQRNIPINIPGWAIALLVMLALVLLVVFVILGALGRAGLVRGAWLADSGETNLTFSRLFQESQAYFWRVLLLGILIAVISLALIVALIIPGMLTCGLILICLVPIFIALSVIVELAIVGIAGEGLGVIESLQRAWEIFRANLAQIIAIGVVVVIISAVIGFLFSLPLIAILAPAMILINSGSAQASNGGLIASIFLGLLYLPILLAVQAVVTSYVETTWTVTFRRLTGRLAGSTVTPPEPAPVI